MDGGFAAAHAQVGRGAAVGAEHRPGGDNCDEMSGERDLRRVTQAEHGKPAVAIVAAQGAMDGIRRGPEADGRDRQVAFREPGGTAQAECRPGGDAGVVIVRERGYAA
jgi:hypothetical protein